MAIRRPNLSTQSSTKQNLKILQWNANGLLAHLNEFKQFLSNTESAIHIICIQESLLKPNKTLSVSGYDVLRKDRIGENSRGGRDLHGDTFYPHPQPSPQNLSPSPPHPRRNCPHPHPIPA